MDKYIDNEAIRAIQVPLYTTSDATPIADVDEAIRDATQSLLVGMPADKTAVFSTTHIIGASAFYGYIPSNFQREIYLHVNSVTGTVNVNGTTRAEEQVGPLPVQNLSTSVISTAITAVGWYKVMCPALSYLQFTTIAASSLSINVQEISN